MIALPLLLALATPPAAASPAPPAGVQTREFDYQQGDTVLQGFLAYPAGKGQRPGVLVVHEWWGHNQHARNQAIRLAQAGYVGFALDMYGKGKLASHPSDAQAFMAEATKDATVLKARFDAALALLKKDPRVDGARVGAIGYCFGGAVVMGMARAGEDLQAVATFHGAIGTDTPAKAGTVKPRLLVLTGADDPMVGPDVVAAFKKEMDAAGARYEVVSFPGAKHSFTNPDADKAGMPQLAYDAKADTESWARLLKLLKEVFGS
jgi:dienelactone hydrolase